MPAAPYREQPRAILNGQTYPGALLSFSLTGTSDLVTIYADADRTVPLENPIAANCDARWPAIYLADGDTYRARCMSADGDTEIFDDDPVDPDQAPYARGGSFLDAEGDAMPLASLTFFSVDTTILASIYEDTSLVDELDNPLTADASGDFPAIYLDSDLQYRVLLKNGNGELIYDIETLQAIQFQFPGVPVLSGNNVSDTENFLSWTAASAGELPVASYQLERSDNGGAYALIATTLVADPRELSDTDVSAGNVYEYRVRALDTLGNAGDYSNIVEIEIEEDPDFGDVSILLTANTGTLTEWSGLPSYTVIGGGAISSVESKFGGFSFRNPGTTASETNYVRVVDDEDGEGLFVFPGEFTIEGWFFVVAYTDSYDNFFASSVDFPAAGFIQLAIRNIGDHHQFWNSAPGGIMEAGVDVPLNQWVFVAVTRDASNDVRMFLDGVVQTVSGMSGTLGALDPTRSSLDVCKGQASDNADLNCYFDQIRITKKCRYTANFTPPTAPFPTS